jgi:ABC-type dipeptide/oligopeptide/nickel transport system ATPase subunit
MCLLSVMGATGSGKTTVSQQLYPPNLTLTKSKPGQFINLVSGSNLRVGKGLKSCTNIVQMAVPFEIDGLLSFSSIPLDSTTPPKATQTY